MSFQKLCHDRYSCHHFLPNKPIPKHLWQTIFAPVQLTPSGYNCQPWKFIVIEDTEKKKHIQEISFNQKHIADSSAVIVVLADSNIGRDAKKIADQWLDAKRMTKQQAQSLIASMTKPNPLEQKKTQALRSTMLAAMTLIYSLTDMGLASCPMMGFNQQKLSEFLALEKNFFPALLIACGYEDPNKRTARLPRKDMSEIVDFL